MLSALPVPARRTRCCRAAAPAASCSACCSSCWPGSRLDPLRADNFDFALVGPDWLSIVAFTALALFQGMLTWAVAARLRLPPLPLGRSLGGTRAVTAGRLAAGALVLVMLPGFLAAVADILRVG